MRSTLTTLVLLLVLSVQAQLQDPDICVSYFAVNGNFQYSGHTYFRYDNQNRKTSQTGVDTITGDTIYDFITLNLSDRHRIVGDYRPDSNGVLTLMSQYEEEYDSTGALIKSITSDWKNGMWETRDFSTRFNYTRDANKRITECVREQYTLLGGWQPTNKTVYTYNSFGDLTMEYYQWNGGWQRHLKKEQSVIGSGSSAFVSETVWSVDPFNNSETRTEYTTYTTSGGTHMIHPSAPEPYLKDYNDNPGRISRSRYDQNGNLNGYERVHHISTNDSSIVLTERYNDSTMQYEPFQRRLIVRDQKGQPTLSVNQEWKAGVWENLGGFSISQTYNGNKMTEQTQKLYNSTSKQFDNYARNRYKFTRPIGLMERQIAFEMMPNPASDVLYLRVKGNQAVEVEIYNSQGVLILQKVHQPGLNFLPVHTLSSGNYFVRMIEDGVQLGVEQLIIH